VNNNKSNTEDSDHKKEDPDPDSDPYPDSDKKYSVESGNGVNSSGKNNKGHSGKLLMLSLGALGIVYGDIGTSPLYALRECFGGEHGIHPNDDNVFGVLSLIFWSLIIIISVKYLIIVMRADNDGEGGVLALMSLFKPEKSAGWKYIMILGLGLFGAALLYGDGIITPAISVLSAVEGLTLATPFFEPYIIPVTILILTILFSLQNKGTTHVGKIFGPVTLIWFICIAILGMVSIVESPEVLYSVNPFYAYNFFAENGWHGFLILGSVFLVVTGGEALYADMGHFGKKPIKLAWFSLVLPCLLINYFGQGALILRTEEAAANPFYLLCPPWALYPMIILAAIATSIASQAVISGAFSLTYQALQLGFLPRMKIVHTSEDERGQIYIPQLNWLLYFATISLVLGFGSSGDLAAAYGIAVTTTMVITTVILFEAMRKLWNWSFGISVIVTLFFLFIDLSFWGANILKIFQGGWVPLVIGGIIYLLMTTWSRGRKNLNEKIRNQAMSLDKFITEILSIRMIAIPGSAVYMSSSNKGAPQPLILNIQHNRLLHKQIIILTIKTQKVPYVHPDDCLKIEIPTEGFFKVTACFGFMDKPNINHIIDLLDKKEVKINLSNTTFFLGRETLISIKKKGFNLLRDKLFIFMSNNAQRATEFFQIPANRVFEVGTQVEL